MRFFMLKNVFILLLLFIAPRAFAQSTTILPQYNVSSGVNTSVSATTPLPVTLGSGFLTGLSSSAGTLPVTNGGTGRNSLCPNGDTMVSNGSSYSCAAGAGLINSVGGCELTIVGTELVIAECPSFTFTQTTATIGSTQAGAVVNFTNVAGSTVSSASASSSGMTLGYGLTLNNAAVLGSGNDVWTPTGSTVGGSAALTISPILGCHVYSDGTNFQIDYAACSAITARLSAGTSGQVQYAGSNGYLAGTAYVTISTTGVTLNNPTLTGTIVGVAATSSANTYSATQSVAPDVVSDSSGTFTPSASAGNPKHINLVHGETVTIANPSGSLIAGTTYLYRIKQSATGSDTIGTWGNHYSFLNGSTPTLSTTAGRVDLISCYAPDTTYLECQISGTGGFAH